MANSTSGERLLGKPILLRKKDGLNISILYTNGKVRAVVSRIWTWNLDLGVSAWRYFFSL